MRVFSNFERGFAHDDAFWNKVVEAFSSDSGVGSGVGLFRVQ